MNKMIALSLGLLLSLSAGSALAQEGDAAKSDTPMMKMDDGAMSHEGMEMGRKGMGKGMGMGKSDMRRGMDMDDVDTNMQALRDHSKMMEEITDPTKLSEEMKKHMRMMDEMMEHAMRCQMEARSGSGTSSGPEATP